MTNIMMGIILAICILPTIWMICFLSYPKDLKSSKLIFGVKNRDEFADPGIRETVEKVIEKYRKKGLRLSWILTAICGVIFILTLSDILSLVMFVWIMYIFVSLILITVPYWQGNREMMDIKRSLGLSTEKGVIYTDLNNAGAVKALNVTGIMIPNALGLIIVLAAFLKDAGVLNFGRCGMYPGYLTTAMCLTFWIMGVVMTVIGFVIDRMKNEIISVDSDVNANYNRARKKTLADLMISFVWVNTLYIAVFLLCYAISGSEILFMISMGIYTVLLMAALAVCVSRMKKVEQTYRVKTDIVMDDDEYWIGGMFYCNPSDKRLNVEKRVGVGSTINMAHPVGKVISVILALTIAATLLLVVWVGMLEITPISLRIEGDSLICHQLRDEYVIPLETIESAEYISDIKTVRLSRSSGVGMEELLKGDFVELNSSERCKVFLNPGTGSCIRIEASGRVYYVSSGSADETSGVWNILKDMEN